MSGLKFDYYVLNTYVPELDGAGPELYRRWAEQVALAEELGFGCAWFTEHHFRAFGGMLPSPMTLMAALAQHTQRIRLGTAVVILPLHNPLIVAEQLAMLDVLSGGRLDVGVGRGMASQYHEAFGSDPETAQERFEEAVELLRAAWTNTTFRWDGMYYPCPNPITVLPRPVQQPHPPIWVPCGSNAANSRWIGRQGVNLMTLPWQAPTFAVTQNVIAGYRAGLREAGHDEGGLEVLGYLNAYVGETLDEARRDAEVHWEHQRRISGEQRNGPEPAPLSWDVALETGRAIFGDAALCRRHVQRIAAELDVDRLALCFHFGGLPQDKVLASMRRFAAEVAPCFAA